MPSWFPEDNLLGLVVGGIALAISLVNLVRNSRVADRQFVQGFYQDIAKWLANVLALMRDATDNLSRDLEEPDKKESFERLHRDLTYQSDLGLIYFGQPISTDSNNQFEYPLPIAITKDVAEKCWAIAHREPFEVSIIDVAFFSLSSNELMEVVTSAFKVGNRLTQATAGRLGRRSLTPQS